MDDLLSGRGGPKPRKSEHSDTAATCSGRITAPAWRELRQLLGSAHPSGWSPPVLDTGSWAKAPGHCPRRVKRKDVCGREVLSCTIRGCCGRGPRRRPGLLLARGLHRAVLESCWGRGLGSGPSPALPLCRLWPPEDPGVLPRSICWLLPSDPLPTPHVLLASFLLCWS